MNQKAEYFAAFKPYNMLSQFTDREGRDTLARLGRFARSIYPVGRLDMDSEGLLLLTSDKTLTDRLLNPVNVHEREYYVFVEGKPDADGLRQLEEGVIIEKKQTLPAKAKLIDEPVWLPAREPKLWLKPSLTYSWISLTITEGRNRQVRKMTAHIGHPTIRLVRYRIASITVDGLTPGRFRALSEEEIALLKKL